MTIRLGFRLTKWYLDAVSDTGEVFIGYQAHAALAGVSLQHASILVSGPEGEVRTATTSTRAVAPALDSSGVRWSLPRLGLAGVWTPTAPAVSRGLLESPRGNVDWSCVVPAARVHLDLAEGHRLDGWGYAEVLELTIPPWRLPIAELRWGRFVAEGASLVWIDWKGALPLSFAAVGASPCTVAEVGESRVVLESPPATLVMSEPRIIRDGPLARTALSRVPLLRERLPVRMLQTHETKWLSRAVLEAGGATREGWAIHEVVRWP